MPKVIDPSPDPAAALPEPPSARDLIDAALPLDGDRRLVPEPVVKRYLRAHGLTVPRGVAVSEVGELDAAAADLHEPFALKIFGPGVVHKTELGAVRLGQTRETLAASGREMRASVEATGARVGGFLLEEEQAAGVELLVGAVVRDGVTILICGLGGTDTESLDQVSARLTPIDGTDARTLVAELRGSFRPRAGRRIVTADEEALAATLLRLGGADGVIAELRSEHLLEFECNPIIVGPDGISIVDARLVLGEESGSESFPSTRDLTPLFAPRTIAIAGVSTSGRGLGNMALEAYRRLGWDEGLYVLHPRAEEVGGTPAVPTLADVPEGRVDYLKVIVPAARAEELIAAEGPRAGVIQLITGGFGELGGEHREREDRIVATARAAGVPLVGPNCIGVYCPAGRQTFQLDTPEEIGVVAVVAQSGGVCGDIIEMGMARGLRFSKVLSIGNGLDVTPAEVVDHLVDDPDTAVIGLYVEDLRDAPRFVAAARRARGLKPIVLLAAGVSRSGAMAAASHTGALATDRRLLEALASSLGVVVVPTLEALAASVLALQWEPGREPANAPAGVLVVGHGGGNTVIAGDACEQAGLEVPDLGAAALSALESMPADLVKNDVNPLELMIGPNVDVGSTRSTLEAVLVAQRFSHVLLHCSVRSFYAVSTRFIGKEPGGIDLLVRRLRELGPVLPNGTRVVVAARAADSAPTEDRLALSRAAAEARIPLYFNLHEAVQALAALRAFDQHRRARTTPG